jgi:hypothetical protein
VTPIRLHPTRGGKAGSKPGVIWGGATPPNPVFPLFEGRRDSKWNHQRQAQLITMLNCSERISPEL